MSDFDALRKTAEAATPGPWTQDGHHMSLVIKCTAERRSPDARHLCGDYINVADAGENWMVDAPYIAAANPAVVLALLNRVEKAEALAELLAESQEENSRLRALLARAGKALAPFARSSEVSEYNRESQHPRREDDHVVLWPFDFGTMLEARTVSREIEEAISHE